VQEISVAFRSAKVAFIRGAKDDNKRQHDTKNYKYQPETRMCKMSQMKIQSATSSASIADILERVLDMGVVIAGDIRIKLVDIELLTIQIRLVVCSIDKAKEIGMDWWNVSLDKKTAAPVAAISDDATLLASRLETVERRMKDLEKSGVLKR